MGRSPRWVAYNINAINRTVIDSSLRSFESVSFLDEGLELVAFRNGRAQRLVRDASILTEIKLDWALIGPYRCIVLLEDLERHIHLPVPIP